MKKALGVLGTGFLLSFGAVLALILGIVVIVVVSDAADDPIEAAFPRAKTKNGVFIIPLQGEIVSSHRFERVLSRALEREEVKAIVVAIDSPGGAVGPSEAIFRTIKKADAKKPVFCAMEGVAASGGLYSAVGCRKIYANSGTLTGSIGVIMSYPSAPEVLNKLGVQMNVVKSGPLKDVGSPFRAPTEGDRQFLQELVSATYEHFVQAVASGRKLPVEKVRSFADGRVILGAQAKELGLVDEIGGVEEAAKAALEAAGNSEEPELLYAREKRSFASVIEESKAGFLHRALTGVQLLYRADF